MKEDRDPHELEYMGGTFPLTELAQQLDLVWAELGSRGMLHEEALAAGIDGVELDRLLKHARADVVSVEKKGSGIDPATTLILVKLMGVVALDLWKAVLLPYVQKRAARSLQPPKH